MVQRCHNPKNHAYSRYGGRGIEVCQRWRDSFVDFMADVGPRPSLAHEIDRIDNEKGYAPGNVRWATSKQQGRNRSTNHRITALGETLCIVEWSERTGLSKETIRQRLKRGWSPERAVTAPLGARA